MKFADSLAAALRLAAHLRDEYGVTTYVVRGVLFRATYTRPASERDIVAIYPAHGYRRPHARYR